MQCHAFSVEYRQNIQQSTNLNILLPSCLLLGAVISAAFITLILIIIILRCKHRKQQGLVSPNSK